MTSLAADHTTQVEINKFIQPHPSRDMKSHTEKGLDPFHSGYLSLPSGEDIICYKIFYQ
jgi:hypothetical protein